MKYLKKFENHTAYETYINGSDVTLPNVSLCVQQNEVHYNPIVPPIIDGHEYVEIGGIKWATMNVGAESASDTGLYFQWGDTQGYTAAQVGSGSGKKYFAWSDYKYATNPSQYSADMTKYNNADGLTMLLPEDDAATAAWGSNWRMPTTEEYQALGTATTTAWTADYQGSGVSGLVLTDKTDETKILFFPACGYCEGGRVSSTVGRNGRYWSSSLYIGDAQYGQYFYFLNSTIRWKDGFNRYAGCNIRPVAD